jgi:hypothetical protein
MGAYLAHRRISVAKIMIKQAYDTIPPPAGVDPMLAKEEDMACNRDPRLHPKPVKKLKI